jgi:MoxR-like ATPase
MEDLPLVEVHRAVTAEVVGRQREVRLVLAAVTSGRDLVLEGPPGTSKSTLLRAITTAVGAPLMFVEGNADLTTAKLVGHHNPSQVLREDFSAATFVEGPLVHAMREGGFLYVEEINRAPEDTLNALLTAIAEREITVPRVGIVRAAPGFRLVASMNPFDNVGTARISRSVHDRLCRVVIGYQSADEECEIVRRRSASADEELIEVAVDLTRATRHHDSIRQGSSVRGAIDFVFVAEQLLELESETKVARADDLFDAMLVALSGRIEIDETADRTPEQILREIFEDRYILRPRLAAPG